MTPDKSRRARNDLILVFSGLAAVLLIALAVFLTRDGDSVTVTVDGEVYATYALSVDARVEIETAYGRNVLVLSNGAAYIESADCKDRLCVYHAPISYGGECIICLPHRLTVRISSGDAPDVTG